MLYIENLKDNTIQLDRSRDINYRFEVTSVNEDGKKTPISIYFLSNQSIDASIIEENILSVHIDAARVLEEAYLTLFNGNNDMLIIKILPNEYYTTERTYTFKITSKKTLEDGTVKIKLLSKVNDEEIGWTCTYDGKPMDYIISPYESDKGEYVSISPIASIISEFDSVIEFTQIESNNKIRITLTNMPNVGISEIKKVD